MFDIAAFFEALEIPEKEHAAIRRCLATGLGNYYLDIYGYNKYGKRPDYLIEDRMSEPYIFGYRAAKILEHKRISKETKLKVCQYALGITNPGLDMGLPYGLCWAWLGNRQDVGAPPAGWRVMDAVQTGDMEQVKQFLQSSGIAPEEEDLRPLEELIAGIAEEELGLAFELLRGARFILIPDYLKRLAVPTLVRFGEDAGEMVEKLWDSGEFYDLDDINNGIADTIRQYRDNLPPDQLRRLVERGLGHGQATVRKTFYALSTEFYDNQYLERALEDKAKSIQNWAAKKLRKRR